MATRGCLRLSQNAIGKCSHQIGSTIMSDNRNNIKSLLILPILVRVVGIKTSPELLRFIPKLRAEYAVETCSNSHNSI